MLCYGMDAGLDATGFLITLADRNIAGAVHKEASGADVFIRPVVVAEGRQKQGIGRVLIERIRSDVPQVWVAARGTAVGFYARSGFTPSC